MAHELHEAILVEAAKVEPDTQQVLHLVAHHLDAKRMRLSPEDFENFETFAEFEDIACELFPKPLGGLSWQLSKEMATELALIRQSREKIRPGVHTE